MARSRKKKRSSGKLRKKNKHPGQHPTTKADSPELWVTAEVMPETLPTSTDEVSIENAKAHWLLGEWHELSKLSLNTNQNTSERALLAILIASAKQQLGEHNEARKLTQCALELGCEKILVAQILTAGIYNTLGRVSALNEDENLRKSNFEKAISTASSSTNIEVLSQTRSVREMSRLGLLPQAAKILGEEVNNIENSSSSHSLLNSRMQVLQTEIELLKHEFSIAQQRHQFYKPVETSVPPDRAFETLDNNLRDRALAASVSQLGQDVWVLEKTQFKRNGFFVEFGATDGVSLSNTYLLEKEFSWAGICAEPNPKLFTKLEENRNCKVSNACIAGYSGQTVDFILADVYGGMATFTDHDMHGEKRRAYQEIGETIKLPTISLHDFLGQHEAPHTIDYLSVDTEGSEYEILSHFPFEKWNIRLLTVEHNHTDKRKKIRELLEKHGYVCTEAKWDDWFEKVAP